MTRCSCGRVNVSGTTYCPACGKTVNHALCLAASCGARNDLDATFCRACGSTNLTAGAPAKSLWFLPPLVLLCLISLVIGLLWASGLLQAAEKGVGIALSRTRYYLHEAISVAIFVSVVYLFLPEKGRKAVDSLLRLWEMLAKAVLAVLARLFRGALALFYGLSRRANAPPRNKP